MPVTLDQFAQRLVASGLLSADELAEFRAGLAPEKRPQDAQALARELIVAGRLTRFQAEAVYRGNLKGLVMGEYVVLDRIGAGGMGEVLKARHRRMERVVAMKVLPSKAVESPDAVKRFYREVKAAARLVHPNIVTAYDASECEGIHYLAMEYVDGQDLARLVKEHGPLSVDEALDCTLQAARGLAYAHGEGVVHRDIKPGNLLLDRKGTIKILDMGLARMELAASDEPERLTASGQVMGTCDYMAPEQAEDTHAADHRADIYSLGCTLYRLLTGRPPYQGDTLIRILLAHREAPVPSLCSVRPDVPQALDAVYQKMLAKRPLDRYQTMEEVIGALEACRQPQEAGAALRGEASSDSALTSFLDRLAVTGPSKATTAPPHADETMPSQVVDDTGPKLPSPVGRGAGGERAKLPSPSGRGAGGEGAKLPSPSGRGAGGEGAKLPSPSGRGAGGEGGRPARNRPALSPEDKRKLKVYGSIAGGAMLCAVLVGLLVMVLGRGGGKDSPLPKGEGPGVRAGGEVGQKQSGPPPLAIAPFNAAQAKKHQEAWAKHLGLPVEWENSIGMKFVLIPPGEFTMGSTDTERQRALEEAKVANDTWAIERIPAEVSHRVKITRPFYLGKYEVAQAQWQSVMGSNPSQFKGSSNPVEQVSWDDIQAFLAKLNAIISGWAKRSAGPPHPGAGDGVPALRLAHASVYALPTEAQWEYACRAGTTTAFHFGDGAAMLGQYGWFDENSGSRTHPVGGRMPNAWGLYDMHGNVWEWCRDRYMLDYYTRSSLSDPSGPDAGSDRVRRGGSWDNARAYCRSAYRHYRASESRHGTLGFRLACEIPTDPAELAKFAAASNAAKVGPSPQQPGQAIDLLATIDIGRDAPDPGFAKEGAVLVTPGHGPRGAYRLVLPCKPVPSEYDLHLVAERKGGGFGINFGFVMEGHQGMVVMDGYGDRGWGLEMIDGKRATDNGTFVRGERFPMDRKVAADIRVRRGSVRVDCDGRQVFSWSGEPGRLSLWEKWQIPDQSALLLGSQAPFRIHELRLTPVGGPGHATTTGQPKVEETPEPAADAWTTLPNGWRIGRPVNLGPAVNSNANDGDPTLSADGLTMIFHSTRAGGQGDVDLWMCRRASLDAPFGAPVNLGPKVNSSAKDYAPFLTPDGLTIFFASRRPGGLGGADLWMCTRSSAQAAFGEPVHLGPRVNSDTDEGGALLLPDGLTLLFNSCRQGGKGNHDLWICKRPALDAPFGEPVNLGPTVNSEANDGDPALSPDGLTLVFTSDRPGGSGSYDLWACAWPGPDAPFGPAVNLGPAINSEATDGVPCFSPDETGLFFASDRPGGSGGIDLWMCPRLKPHGGNDWTTLPNGWRIGPPVNLGPVVNAAEASCPCLSADGLTLLFHSTNREGGHGGADLWMSTRRSAAQPWTAPINLGPTVNSVHHECGPCLSKDGLTLLFYSNRPGGEGEEDLWMCTRPRGDAPWDAPLNLGPTVNSDADDSYPCLSADRLSLLFASQRAAGQGALDLWISTRRTTAEPWAKPLHLGPSVNSAAHEGSPCLSADALTLFFFSGRAGGAGKHDIWVSTRRTILDPWRAPLNLGPSVNSGGDDAHACLSLDGRTLYFARFPSLWQAPVLPPGMPLPEPLADDARWGPWEDLFDGKTLDGWKLAQGGLYAGGEARVEGGQIVLGPGVGYNAVAWTGALPVSDYELSLEVRCEQGEEICGVTFPYGPRHSAFWATPATLRLYGTEHVPEPRPAAPKRVDLKRGVWYRVGLRVTAAAIEVSVDGNKVSVSREDYQSELAAEAEPSKPLGLGTSRSKSLFRNIRLRRLKPAAADNWALEFDGVRGGVAVPNLEYDGSYPVTIEAWVQPQKIKEAPIVLCRGGKWGHVKLQVGSALNWLAEGPNRQQCHRRSSGDGPKAGDRIHAAAVWNGTELRLFIGGRESLVSPGVISYGENPRQGTYIGSFGDPDPSADKVFQGTIDEVRISKTARYDKDFTPQARFEPDKDTLALYHCDEGQGDVLKDSSGNGHDGRIVGAKWARVEKKAEGGGQQAEK